jgi:hypothetical protein
VLRDLSLLSSWIAGIAKKESSLLNYYRRNSICLDMLWMRVCCCLCEASSSNTLYSSDLILSSGSTLNNSSILRIVALLDESSIDYTAICIYRWLVVFGNWMLPSESFTNSWVWLGVWARIGI